MNALPLHEFHRSLGANFAQLGGAQIVADYGDWLAEYAALRQNAGVLDLSFRSRLCLVGADRSRFLHGQVTNDVKKLRPGEGCYAAITTNKGKMESDLNILCLADELLLDFEPGLTERISQRLEKFIVADDVQVVEAAPHYGLLTIQGPKAEQTVSAVALFSEIPTEPLGSVKITDAMLGEIYLVNHARLNASPLPAKHGEDRSEGQNRHTSPRPPPPLHCKAGEKVTAGFDLLVPHNSLGAVADKLIAAAKQIGGRACGWAAFETVRIENGIPRFGADMDETNIPLECGIEARAVSYTKGCYIGQEVVNRIHSIGRVNRELRGLKLADNLPALPARGDKLFFNDKEIGHVTSAVKSPLFGKIALGYVRREANQIGAELILKPASGESPVKIVKLPLAK